MVSHKELLETLQVTEALVHESCLCEFLDVFNNATYERVGKEDFNLYLTHLCWKKNVAFEGYQHMYNNDLKTFAYIVQTSGTTGRPKIVGVPHEVIVENIESVCSVLSVSESDRIPFTSPLTFDVSFVQILCAWAQGGSLLLCSNQVMMHPSQFARTLRICRATILMVTPSLFQRFSENDMIELASGSCRAIVMGGECFPVASLKKFWPRDTTVEFFNIYGVTECSCWATMKAVKISFNLPLDSLEARWMENTERNAIPLGKSLNGTRLFIEISEDFGMGNFGEVILIRKKPCMMWERNSGKWIPITVHRTGDIARIDGDCIYFVGRKGMIFKRQGYRLHPDQIASWIKTSIVSINDCVLFVEDIQMKPSVILCVSFKNQHTRGVYNAKTLLEACRKFLPGPAIPDDTIIFEKFPITANGKLDIHELRAIYKRKVASSTTVFDKTSCKCLIINAAASMGIKVSETDFKSLAVHIGIDSQAAVRLAELLSKSLCSSDRSTWSAINAKSLELLLSQPLHCVASYLQETFDRTGLKSEHDTKELESHTLLPRTHHVTPSLLSSDRSKVDLSVKYKYSLGKCIDASPLIVEDMNAVLIGSHSHRFAAVALNDGQAFWDIGIADRIDSSAIVVQDRVVFGSYDGNLYVLDLINGNILWTFRTGGPVKSSPILFPEYPEIVIFGSHDGWLYCVNVIRKKKLWGHRPDGNAIFASPIFDEKHKRIYCCTLGGNLACLGVEAIDEEGCPKAMWSYTLPKPIFATPAIHPESGHVFVGCVDKSLYCVDTFGNLQWSFEAQEMIFSSPKVVVFESGTCVLFGSHDGCLYCINESGHQQWKKAVGKTVFSSPGLMCKSGANSMRTIVACATSGEVLILSFDGSVLGGMRLPGEIFSSPKCLGSCIFVGCRDDNLYCLQASFQKT
eukprot:m.32154 g.32154  ORF g.32154 m.32154 type:complete len:913 (+) comp8380_c0_seq3:376-3114(+)